MLASIGASAKRGLLNHRTSVDAYPEAVKPEVVGMFEKYGRVRATGSPTEVLTADAVRQNLAFFADWKPTPSTFNSGWLVLTGGSAIMVWRRSAGVREVMRAA